MLHEDFKFNFVIGLVKYMYTASSQMWPSVYNIGSVMCIGIDGKSGL